MATHDVGNWLKLNILIDRACAVLRQLFKKSWKARFGDEWCGTETDIDTVCIQKKIQNIGKLQMQSILTGDVNSWDFTTLRAILTSRDFLCLTAEEVSNIKSLASIRNKLAHCACKGITDSELYADWCIVASILVEFGESEAELEQLKHGSRLGGVEFTNTEESVDVEATLLARRLKVAGNAQFELQDWAESINSYTQAIELDGIPSADLAALHSNRSAAYLKLKELKLALEDAKKTIEHWPEWWKGHYRQGLVYTEMKKYKLAEACFDEAFAREQNRDEIKEERCYAQMKQVEMEEIDSMVSKTANQTLEDIISQFEGITVTLANPDSITIKDHLLNWQSCQLGHKYQTGSDGFPQDYKAAAEHYKNASDRGSAEALYSLALLTFEGKGVKREMLRGIKMLQMAAGKKPLIEGSENVGVAQSEHALGLFYERGIGVKKDTTEAGNWYKRASEHGSLMATNDLGLMYRREEDAIEAELHFKMAADKGYVKAMLNLADHYNNQGKIDSAIEWCQRARDAGVTGPEIDRIEKSSNDVLSAFKESGVEEWEAKNGKTAAGLSMKERAKRFLCQLDPKLAAFIRQNNDYCKQLAMNHEDIRQASRKFPIDQLAKYATRSSYARELQKAQNHSIAAELAMDNMVGLQPLPMPMCETFITELAACAKIDYMVAELQEDVHHQACSLVDYLLTLKTSFHEDTCVCYVALNGMFSQKATMIFLNECVRRYPKNVFFVRMRSQMNSMMGYYEDGIRDITASIRLDPSRYEYLFDRARLMMLYYPSVSAESTIEAYKEFVAVAPDDDRMIPESYYGIAKMHYASASAKRNELVKDLSATKHYFDLGVRAEMKQLPFFLPYKSNTKAYVEQVVKSEFFAEPKPSASKQSQSHGPDKSKAASNEKVFRPALSNPIREILTKRHRKAVISFPAAAASSQYVSIVSVQPGKVQQSARSLSGLKAITVHEMDHRQDKVYKGYVLDVTIIDEMVIISSLTVIVEDSCGDVIPLTIANWQREKDNVRSKFGIGCKMSIINPYMRLATDGQSVIRVDDPKSIVPLGRVEKMCRYCCEPNASKSCVKCKANYCDKQCQMLDWKRDHKLVCRIIP